MSTKVPLPTLLRGFFEEYQTWWKIISEIIG